MPYSVEQTLRRTDSEPILTLKNFKVTALKNISGRNRIHDSTWLTRHNATARKLNTWWSFLWFQPAVNPKHPAARARKIPLVPRLPVYRSTCTRKRSKFCKPVLIDLSEYWSFRQRMKSIRQRRMSVRQRLYASYLFGSQRPKYFLVWLGSGWKNEE